MKTITLGQIYDKMIKSNKLDNVAIVDLKKVKIKHVYDLIKSSLGSDVFPCRFKDGLPTLYKMMPMEWFLMYVFSKKGLVIDWDTISVGNLLRLLQISEVLPCKMEKMKIDERLDDIKVKELLTILRIIFKGKVTKSISEIKLQNVTLEEAVQMLNGLDKTDKFIPVKMRKIVTNLKHIDTMTVGEGLLFLRFMGINQVYFEKIMDSDFQNVKLKEFVGSTIKEYTLDDMLKSMRKVTKVIKSKSKTEYRNKKVTKSKK